MTRRAPATGVSNRYRQPQQGERAMDLNQTITPSPDVMSRQEPGKAVLPGLVTLEQRP